MYYVFRMKGDIARIVAIDKKLLAMFPHTDTNALRTAQEKGYTVAIASGPKLDRMVRAYP